MVLSLEAVANQLISGCQSQAKIGPLWAVNWDRHLSCFLKSQSCTLPFSDTAAKVCIWWGLNCTSRMLSVLLQKFNNCFWILNLCKYCVLEPDKISCCFFYPQVKTFHGPVLRAGDQPKSLRGVKANFIDSSSVVIEDVLLFRSSWLIEIPYNHGAVCGCCRQDTVCNAKHNL